MRKTVQDGIASVTMPIGHPDNLMAVLGQVEAAEVFSVYDGE
jgi:hypothetical protein